MLGGFAAHSQTVSFFTITPLNLTQNHRSSSHISPTETLLCVGKHSNLDVTLQPEEDPKMDDEEGKNASSTNERRFDLDLSKYLEDSTDEPPPEIIVVKKGALAGGDRSHPGQREQPTSPEGMEKIRLLSDQDLEEAIRRMTAHVNKGFCSKLPDKGEKYKGNLRCHQEERERRRLQTGMQDAKECTRVEDTKWSRPIGASAEAKKEASSCQAPFLSEFASKLNAKLEAGSTSCTWVPEKEQVICDAFDKDLKNSGRADRRKSKKQKTQFTHNEKQKNGLSFKGKGKPRSVSIKTFYDDQSDLTENNEIQKQKDACQELSSDRSNSNKTVVLLDEEEPGLGDTTGTAEVGLRGTTLYYPSSEDPESVEIQIKDLNCLAPGEYLTSTIMNFYIRYLQGPSFAANNAPNDYHFFNTYFYKKLQEAILRQRMEKESSFVKFRRWWRGVQIFQKAYIFLPVHEDHHWSLAIVCIPDKADGCGPIILHLDSLGFHSSRSVFENIRRFLKEEWNILKEGSDPPDDFMTSRIWKHLPRRIEERIITVPQQNNDFDCGLFVLYFMERFIEDAPQRLRKQDLGMFGKRWFKPEEASNLRGKIKMKLKEEFQKLNNTFEPVHSPVNGELAGSPETPTAS